MIKNKTENFSIFFFAAVFILSAFTFTQCKEKEGKIFEQTDLN